MSQAVPVRRGGDNVLRTSTVPVVFVPGVMGSRLRLGGETWDPDSNLNMVGWAMAGAESTRRQLALESDGRVMDAAGEEVPADRLARGWAGVSWRFYGAFLRHLDAQRFGSVSTPVHAVGYDWRQDNRASGRAVAARIGEILQEHGAQRYILVSHSMGGLVTRAMLKQDAGVAAKAMGVVHLAQPALGAAVFYRRMFTGARAGPDGSALDPPGIVLRNILGTSRESFQTILSALPGPMQLMVTPQYRDTPPGGEPRSWLSITPFEAPARRDVEVGWGSYLAADSPPGLLAGPGDRHALPPARDADMRARLADAQGFHEWLGAYKHEKTWAIFGDGLETDMGAAFDLPPQSDRDYRMLTAPGGPRTAGMPQGYVAQRSDGGRWPNGMLARRGRARRSRSACLWPPARRTSSPEKSWRTPIAGSCSCGATKATVRCRRQVRRRCSPGRRTRWRSTRPTTTRSGSSG